MSSKYLKSWPIGVLGSDSSAVCNYKGGSLGFIKFIQFSKAFPSWSLQTQVLFSDVCGEVLTKIGIFILVAGFFSDAPFLVLHLIIFTWVCVDDVEGEKHTVHHKEDFITCSHWIMNCFSHLKGAKMIKKIWNNGQYIIFKYQENIYNTSQQTINLHQYFLSLQSFLV